MKHVRDLTEAQPDSDDMIGSHIEHDIDHKKEKEAERQKLQNFLKIGLLG
jgi:hypothetical protein